MLSLPLWALALFITAVGLRWRELGRPLWRSTKVKGSVVGYVQLGEFKTPAHVIDYSPKDSLRIDRFVEPPRIGVRRSKVGDTVRLSYTHNDPSVIKRYSNGRRVGAWLAIAIGLFLLLVLAAFLRPLGIGVVGVMLLSSVIYRVRTGRSVGHLLAYRSVESARLSQEPQHLAASADTALLSPPPPRSPRHPSSLPPRAGARPTARIIDVPVWHKRFVVSLLLAAFVAVAVFGSLISVFSGLATVAVVWWFRDRVSTPAGSPVSVIETTQDATAQSPT